MLCGGLSTCFAYVQGSEHAALLEPSTVAWLVPLGPISAAAVNPRPRRTLPFFLSGTQQAVYHRDIKLENTLLEQAGSLRLKLCDFGYSKASGCGVWLDCTAVCLAGGATPLQ